RRAFWQHHHDARGTVIEAQDDAPRAPVFLEHQRHRALLEIHEEHVSRRVADWLKLEARREIEARARAKAEQLGKQVKRVILRDTKSRWGSCTTDGVLSFSWRLILAPRHVMDY